MLFCLTNFSAEILLQFLGYTICTEHHILAVGGNQSIQHPYYPYRHLLLPPHGTMLMAFADVKYACCWILDGLVSTHPYFGAFLPNTIAIKNMGNYLALLPKILVILCINLVTFLVMLYHVAVH
jgi:hypothetical protein